MAVLSCNGKNWFTALEQAAMGAGSAGPAYNKAKELYDQAYAVRWTKPVPEAGSTTAKAMDADLATASALLSTLSSSSVSTAEIGSSLTAMETLCASIVANDIAWAASSGRPPPTAESTGIACSFLHPLVCVEQVGGALLKWAVIGAAVYFGGKWILKKLDTPARKRA